MSLSRSADSYFHLCTACTREATRTGLPPSSFTPTTLPSEATVSRTRATPWIFILRASSGYSGGTLTLSFRVLVCACVVCEIAGDIASVFQSSVAVTITKVDLKRRKARFEKVRIIISLTLLPFILESVTNFLQRLFNGVSAYEY